MARPVKLGLFMEGWPDIFYVLLFFCATICENLHHDLRSVIFCTCF